jgi:hypothetical protein
MVRAPDNVLAAILDLIAPHPPNEYSPAGARGCDYLESFLSDTQVSLTANERQAIENLLERHASNIGSQRQDLQRLIDATSN